MPLLRNIRSFNLLFGFVALIIVLGAFATAYTVRYAERVVKESLMERTRIIAAALHPEEVAALAGTQADLASPAYFELKERLVALAGINPDVQFVYLTGKRDDIIFFFADSEPSDSEDYSPPGQEYPEATPLFHSVFDKGESALEGPVSDRWGTWISALSPIIGPDGRVIAVAGLDISARTYYDTLMLYAAVPVLVTVLLAGLAFFIYRINKREGEFAAFKSELASIAAHDLRTPLVGINWSLDALLEKEPSGSAYETRTLRAIRNAGTRLLEAIDNILETFRLDKQRAMALVCEPYDLTNVLEDVLALFTLSAEEKKLTIERTLIPSSIPMAGDKQKISRVFSNLIANAVKYAPSGTAITLSHEETPQTHVLRIENGGPQVPPAERGNLFREFYRNRKTAQTAYGMGLGLYYVKRMIELHRGRVWYEVRGDKNIFAVELPKKS